MRSAHPSIALRLRSAIDGCAERIQPRETQMPAKTRADSRSPTGTVTFLFTDIEGSTKMWEADPEAMGVILARHDALMRDSIVNANGHVFKTVGDAFCAAFATAPDAVVAALSA